MPEKIQLIFFSTYIRDGRFQLIPSSIFIMKIIRWCAIVVSHTSNLSTYFLGIRQKTMTPINELNLTERFRAPLL